MTTERMADSPAAQAARDRRDKNLGRPTGQAAPDVGAGYAAAQEQAKAKRQPLVDQSAQVETFKAALRMQESGSYEGDYVAQGKWIEGQVDKSIGAYGIMSKNWDSYTSAAGIPKANWRDSRSQDRVAGQMVNKLANSFGGNWGLVATAWFAGSDMANRVVDKYGYRASVQQIGEILGPTIGDYATQVVSNGSNIQNSQYGIEHNLVNFSKDAGFASPRNRQAQPQGSAQDAVRERLVTLAGMSSGRSTKTVYGDARESESGGSIEEGYARGTQEYQDANPSSPPSTPHANTEWEDMTYEERGDLLADYKERINQFGGDG